MNTTTALLFIVLSLAATGTGLATNEAATALTPPDGIEDKPIDAYKTQLLQFAFETASMIPLYPHIKDHAKMQEFVVSACYELNQPIRGFNYAAKIPNWRRGYAYAAFALYCANHGVTEGLDPFLTHAELLARNAGQDWRKHRVTTKIAQVHARLGQTDKALEMAKDVDDSQKGSTETVVAEQGGEAGFDRISALLDSMIESKLFDRKRNALVGYVNLYGKFYDNADRRAMIEEKVAAGVEDMPPFIKIELYLGLTENAVKHGDKKTAMRHLDVAESFKEQANWKPRYGVPFLAKLARLRFQAGDEEGGRKALDETLAYFNQNVDQIINIYRAEALRPLAEAYHQVGLTDAARDVYRLVLDQGVVNPNSRPRAEDLTATCVSMALQGVEPDDAMWARIFEIKRNLSDPW